MKLIVGLVVVLFVVSGYCGSGEDSDEGNKWNKKKECMRQTNDLKACCPMPKNQEEFMNDPECGHLLEGMQDKKGKERFHAIICFAECMFTSRGLLTEEEKDVKWDDLKKVSNELLGESDDFKDVTEKAIDFCEAAFNDMKGFKPKHPHHPDDEKRCGWKAFGAIKCIAGYIVRDCPESVWTGTDECNAIKANATSVEDCMKNN